MSQPPIVQYLNPYSRVPEIDNSPAWRRLSYSLVLPTLPHSSLFPSVPPHESETTLYPLSFHCADWTNFAISEDKVRLTMPDHCVSLGLSITQWTSIKTEVLLLRCIYSFR